jgi:glycerophosphoryl diester phosphodiesterase
MPRKPHLGLGWTKSASRPLILGHRGASAHEPENTMAAFDHAMRAGADGFELDVRLSACGKLLVFHDDDLQRLCGDPRRVQGLKWEELAAMRVSGERIPLLREVLETFPDALVNVEMKMHPLPLAWPLTKATQAVIEGCRARSRVLVSSFDPRLLAMMRLAAPHIPRGLLFHAEQVAPLRNAWHAGGLTLAAIHPDQRLVTAEMVGRAHRQGRKLNTWTVDDPDRIRELAAIGVDAMICNDPAAALEALEP